MTPVYLAQLGDFQNSNRRRHDGLRSKTAFAAAFPQRNHLFPADIDVIIFLHIVLDECRFVMFLPLDIRSCTNELLNSCFDSRLARAHKYSLRDVAAPPPGAVLTTRAIVVECDGIPEDVFHWILEAPFLPG